MSKTLSTALGIAAILAVTCGAARADDQKYNESQTQNADALVRSTVFVWFTSLDEFASNNGKLKAALKEKVLAEYPELGGFLVSEDSETLRKIAEAAGVGDMVSVELNEVVHGFNTGCRTLTETAADGEVDDLWGLKRVAPNPNSYSGTAAAWIVDSGISSEYDSSELNVVSRRYCPANFGTDPCPIASGKDKRDDIGHGTMLAGIIGAKRDNKIGIIGVAPGAPLNVLKVFDGTEAVTSLDRVIQALLWLDTKLVADNDNTTPSPGDVVNLSLGLRWNPLPGSSQRRVEALIRKLADKGLKIAIAAGNVNTLGGQGYVQTISPARAGGYVGMDKTGHLSGGVVMTASAIAQNDNFWPFSAFGNYSLDRDPNGAQKKGPPDFAEPGDEITSLWPNNSLAVCSGTSFAAAHLSGLLLLGMPHADPNMKAKGDLSAEKPAQPGQFDPNLTDPIGVR